MLRGLQLRRHQQPGARDTPPAEMLSSWRPEWCYDDQHCANKGLCNIQTDRQHWGELRCALCASSLAFNPATQPAALSYHLQPEGRI